MRVSHTVFEMPCLPRQHGAMLLLQGEVRWLREGKMGGGELCNQERGEHAGKEAKAEWLWGRRHSANSRGTKGEGKGPGCYCRMGSL